MNPIDRLKRDHKILRAKLDVLEAALRMGPETWCVLREISHTLTRQLRDHIRREEALIEACRQALREETVAKLRVEHRDEPEHLRTINRLFVQAKGVQLEHVKPALTTLIGGLRRHMAEEEQELFPLLERILAQQALAQPVAHETRRGPVDEVTTVNSILQQYPHAWPVFEQLFVNIPFEGADCLDEVAWRHGLEARELLAKLEDVIGSPVQQEA